jgi:hypothetical protein
VDPRKKPSLEIQNLEGRYTNYFRVGYNAFEFVIDFGQSYSENDHGELWTRIVTAPVYAKEFLKMLQDSIEAFESTFGGISGENLENPDD